MLKFITIFISYSVTFNYFYGNVKNSLIESTILINSHELVKKSSVNPKILRQRRLSAADKDSIESEIAKTSLPTFADDDLVRGLTATFKVFLSMIFPNQLYML